MFEKAEKVSSWPFVVLVRENGLEHSRLGVVLSKKKVPKAVQRNRIRRLVRESFRAQSVMGLDIVLLPKGGIDKLTNEELISGLGKGWQRCVTYSSKASLA